MTLLPPEEDRRHIVFFHGYCDNHHVPSSAAVHLWEAAASLYGCAVNMDMTAESLPAGACHTMPSSRAEFVDMDVFALSLSHLPNLNLDVTGGSAAVNKALHDAEVAIAERLPPSVELYGIALAPAWFRADARYARVSVGILLPLRVLLTPDIARRVSPAQIVSDLETRQSRRGQMQAQQQSSDTHKAKLEQAESSTSAITFSFFKKMKRVLKLFNTGGVCEYASFCGDRGLPGKGQSTMHEIQSFRNIGGVQVIAGEIFVNLQLSLGRVIPSGLVERIAGLVVAVMQDKLPGDIIPMLLGSRVGMKETKIALSADIAALTAGCFVNLPAVPTSCIYLSSIVFPNGFFSHEMRIHDNVVARFAAHSREASAPRILRQCDAWLSNTSNSPRGFSVQVEGLSRQVFNPLSMLTRKSEQADKGWKDDFAQFTVVLYHLRKISRENAWPGTSEQRGKVIVEGTGNARGGGSFSLGKLIGSNRSIKDCKYNRKFPALYEAVFALERALMPGRVPSAAVAVNRNATFKPHLDSGAGQGQGVSLIVGLGDYSGGELMVEGVPHDIRYAPLEFDGWNERHWTRPFEGERYSLVWFTPKGGLQEDDQDTKPGAIEIGNNEKNARIGKRGAKKAEYLERFMKWLEQSCTDTRTVVDPIRKCEEYRGQEFSKRAAQDLDAAACFFFLSYIEDIIRILRTVEPFLHTDRGSVKGAVASSMYMRLSKALRTGTPADFSNHEELLVYTVGRLRDRSRYLFALHTAVGTGLGVCDKVRQLFLPLRSDKEGMDRTVKVCSIGGASGFDHFAFTALAQFLALLQPRQLKKGTWTEVGVETTVFDLYADHWRPIVESVAGCGEKDNKSSTCSHVVVKQCDIRETLTAPCNKILAASASEADIIVFQFVLHENAKFLRVGEGIAEGEKEVEKVKEIEGGEQGEEAEKVVKDDEEIKKYQNESGGAAAAHGQRIGGSIVGILKCAKLGAVMLCTDAGNRLWPALVATGREHGWVSTPFKRIRNGPKSFCFLERVATDPP